MGNSYYSLGTHLFKRSLLIALVILKHLANIPFSKDRFINFAKETLVVLSKTFKSFVGILLVPIALGSVFFIECISITQSL